MSCLEFDTDEETRFAIEFAQSNPGDTMQLAKFVIETRYALRAKGYLNWREMSVEILGKP